MSNLEPVHVLPQAGLAPPGGPDGQSGPRLPPDNRRLWQHHSRLNCILTYVPLCVWTSSPLPPRTPVTGLRVPSNSRTISQETLN